MESIEFYLRAIYIELKKGEKSRFVNFLRPVKVSSLTNTPSAFINAIELLNKANVLPFSMYFKNGALYFSKRRVGKMALTPEEVVSLFEAGILEETKKPDFRKMYVTYIYNLPFSIGTIKKITENTLLYKGCYITHDELEPQQIFIFYPNILEK